MAVTYTFSDEPATENYGSQTRNGVPVIKVSGVADTPEQAAPVTYTFADDAPKQEKQSPSIASRIAALASGVNRGFYSDLIGLPVDTIQSVVDLGKAAYGVAAKEIFNRPDLMPEISGDRSNIVGSADWLKKTYGNIGLGKAMENPNPDDGMSRILYSGGRVAGASIVPNPNAAIAATQTAANMGMGLTSGLLAGTAAEIDPKYSMLAGMIPQAAGRAAVSAIKGIVRGGEAGRQNMEQRISDFKAGGVETPSVGLASGNRFVQGVENLLSLTPGSVGIYGKSKQAIIDGMQNKTNSIRDSISGVFGPVEAGTAIQADLTGPFKARINNTYGLLNDKVEHAVGSNHYTNPVNSISSAIGMSTPIPGAVATSTPLINNRIAGIASNLSSDVLGTPIYSTPLMNGPIQYKRADGVVMNAPPGIPFGALKNLRTSIGQESQSNAIMGTPEQSQFKRLYGAMSEDMNQAVNSADRINSGVPVGPLPINQQGGAVALNRANNYYSKAMGRADDLNSFANNANPERAYKSVANSLNAGPTTYQKLRGAVQPETRGKIAATVIDDMGMATPGQQGVQGDNWSPRTFLTNYNRIDGSARSELFKRLPGGKQYADDLAKVAKAAEMVGEGSSVWANPAGTASALAARGALTTIGVGMFYPPLMPTAAATASGLFAANQFSKRLLLNPAFVNWLAKAPTVNKNNIQSYMQGLADTAKVSGDAQYKKDVADYLGSIK